MTRYIKQSWQCLTTFPNNSKFVKNTPLRVVFSTRFSVFRNVVEHGLSCLIYFFIIVLRKMIEIHFCSNLKNTMTSHLLQFCGYYSVCSVVRRLIYIERRWYSGEHSCLPSSWPGFDSRPTHLKLWFLFYTKIANHSAKLRIK